MVHHRSSLLLLLLVSCYSDESLDTPVTNPGAGPETALDIYIDENFTQEFGMAIRYRFVDRFVSPFQRVAPPALEAVRPMLDFIEEFWIGPYMEVENGEEFFREQVPAEIVFLGGLLFNEDGTVNIVPTNDLVYDTLRNGKVIARNLPGEIAQVPVDENETYLRNNFDTSDNRNFRDGDKRSSRYFESFNDSEEDEDASTTKKMYNAPRHNVEIDSAGNLIREYDKTNARTSLISDEVRVYKGGSWRDRAYWLDPAQRRYFPQDMATDYIGFRCAMSRIGSKSKQKNKKKN